MTEISASKMTLIVLSYQSGAHIERCLDALVAQPGKPEIILADNGSTDVDFAALKAKFPQVVFKLFGENLGFAVGNNRAARDATGDWLGFVNPDAFAAPEWLSAIHKAIAAHPDVAMFASLQVDANDESRLDGAGDAVSFFGFNYRMGFGQPLPPSLSLADVFMPCGAGFVIRRDLFEHLGGFDEHFFIYCEDADLGFRARLHGARCLFVPEARINHIGSASTGVRSDFALYYGYRNRIWMYVKNMPLVLLLLTAPIHVAMTLLGALKDTRGGKGSVVWRAIGDALKDMPFVLLQRKLIQTTRQISSLRLAQGLTWSPLKIFRRALDHRRPT